MHEIYQPESCLEEHANKLIEDQSSIHEIGQPLEEHANEFIEDQPVHEEHAKEFIEDQMALQHQIQLRGLPYDTVLWREDIIDDKVFSIAPGELIF